jgi:hypothetical protein
MGTRWDAETPQATPGRGRGPHPAARRARAPGGSEAAGPFRQAPARHVPAAIIAPRRPHDPTTPRPAHDDPSSTRYPTTHYPLPHYPPPHNPLPHYRGQETSTSAQASGRGRCRVATTPSRTCAARRSCCSRAAAATAASRSRAAAAAAAAAWSRAAACRMDSLQWGIHSLSQQWNPFSLTAVVGGGLWRKRDQRAAMMRRSMREGFGCWRGSDRQADVFQRVPRGERDGGGQMGMRLC